jgi:hypothetical protein
VAFWVKTNKILAIIAKLAYKQGNHFWWDKPLWLPIRAKHKKYFGTCFIFFKFW